MQSSFITNYADYADIQYDILNTRYNFITDYAHYADFRDYST